MESVFDKFGGIRPMASKLGGVPPSTVKSWEAKRQIPRWRHQSILDAAKANGIKLSEVELLSIPPANDPTPSAEAA